MKTETIFFSVVCSGRRGPGFGITDWCLLGLLHVLVEDLGQRQAGARSAGVRRLRRGFPGPGPIQGRPGDRKRRRQLAGDQPGEATVRGPVQ